MLFVVAALAAGFCMLQIPLKVAFCVRADERVGAALGVRPFAGYSAMKAARMRLENGKPKKKPKKKRNQKPNLGLLWAVGRRLLAHVRLEEMRAQGEMGLSDAAVTALAVGCLQALLRAVGAATGAQVVWHVQPQFQAQCLRGEISGIVSMRVGHIILAALAGVIENSRRRRYGKASD